MSIKIIKTDTYTGPAIFGTGKHPSVVEVYTGGRLVAKSVVDKGFLDDFRNWSGFLSKLDNIAVPMINDSYNRGFRTGDWILMCPVYYKP